MTMATTTELGTRIKELEDHERALFLADPRRQACPCRQLFFGELARVLALTQDLGPVRERAHLAEYPVADHAAHLRQQAGVGRVETAGDELRGLLRAGEWAGKHQRELW